ETDQEAYKAAKKANPTLTNLVPPPPPVCQRVLCSDITIEKVAQILNENPRGVLVHRDELAAWVGSFTRYKSGGGRSDLPHWLEMFRAEPMIVDRKGGDTVYVPRAAVSVCGTIQPGAMRRMLATAEALEAGLTARLLVARPPRTPKTWTDAII